MAGLENNTQLPSALIDTVQEITRIYRSLPPRPSIEEVEAAISVLKTVNTEEQMKLEELFNQEVPNDVPEEIYSVLQHMEKNMITFQSYEQKKEAVHLVELDKMFQTFDDLIQKASQLVSQDPQNQKNLTLTLDFEKYEDDVTTDAALIKKEKNEESGKVSNLKVVQETSISTSSSTGAGEEEKLTLLKVAAFIETFANSGGVVLDLKGKLVDQMLWLPVSIGKLSAITQLDLSENRLMALPNTIGGLKSLTKLAIHSNQLINLPATFGELINLTDLDLHANRLRSLPNSFSDLVNLVSLDLSLNEFTHLPDFIGELNSLEKLNVETNELEELPYSIGSCSSLLELKLDFNQLKSLPEGLGKLEGLEILTLHYNRIRKLPTTMGNLQNLKELDVSFNEIEYIPENLCFATNLRKLNVGKNFADLRSLPRSIGNLEKLEELDISDDQIRVLPDSLRLLSRLRVFRADETPLEIPPKEVAKLGAQAVVEYMADFVAKKDANFSPLKKKKKKKKKKNGFLFRLGLVFCISQK